LTATELRDARQWVKERAEKGTDGERAFVEASMKDLKLQRLQTRVSLAVFLLGLACVFELLVIVWLMRS
jgi:hypothetical protein